MPAVQAHIYDIFQQYSRLYQLRNSVDGQLTPKQQKEWVEVTFTLDSIFSGLYRPEMTMDDLPTTSAAMLRSKVPVDFLRIPTDADVLCETRSNFFSGKLQDISVGGAYVHSPIPFRVNSTVRLTFCTFREHQPLEIEGRIAWSNPGGVRKNDFPEGAGIQFTNCDQTRTGQIQDYVYELVEDTLSRAHTHLRPAVRV